jgi:carbon-monoxide dehydrogenase medium subunit
VIPARFDYFAARSADEAVSALREHGDDAKLIAGGMSLIPLMKLRLATPSVLVDLGRVPDLSFIRDDGDHVTVGALARHCDVASSQLLAQTCGALRAVAAEVGDPQVRHRGTIGGSIAHGDPASDLPAVLLALDASVIARGPRGDRTIPTSELFVDFLETSLRPDEMITEIRVPKAGAAGFAYEKFNRRAQDWATVGAVAVRSNGATRVALVNMGTRPIRATGVEEALAGGASAAAAAEHAAEGTDPPDDLHASPDYRAHLARVLVRRALEAVTA